MNKTCFICSGINSKDEDALVYQEIPRRSRGEEFFVYISPADDSYGPMARRLFRSIISLSRLGHPGQFFSRILELIESSAGVSDPDHGFLDGSMLIVVLKREREVFVLRNRSVEIFHREGQTGAEGGAGSIPGMKEYSFGRPSGQVEMFERRVEDHFILERFEQSPGTHTVIFVPSMEFVERHRAVLMNSVFFPSFAVPDEEVAVPASRSFPGMHWDKPLEDHRRTDEKTRSKAMIRRWIPYTTGAVAALAALLIIFGPFGGRDTAETDAEQPLLSASDEIGGSPEDAEETLRESGEMPEAEQIEAPRQAAIAGGGLSLAEAWLKKFDAPVTSSPAVSSGMVIFGCRDGNLYAFTTEGSLEWKYEAGLGVGASPCVHGQSVICADYEGDVFCLDIRTGQSRWRYRSGEKIVSSPRTDGDIVAACTTEGNLICLSFRDGTRLWQENLGKGIWATPSIGGDYIIVATTDGSLVRMDHSGRVRWRVQPGGEIYSSPLVMESRDLVIFGTGERFVFGYSLSAGNLMWRFAGGSDLRSSPVTDGEDIYIGSEDGVVYSLSYNGVQRWRKDAGGAIRSKPLLIDNYLFITTYGSRLKVYSKADGEVEAEYRVGSPVYSSPATDGSRVYFGSNQGFMHAVEMVRESG